jgi:hypothetical protein
MVVLLLVGVVLLGVLDERVGEVGETVTDGPSRFSFVCRCVPSVVDDEGAAATGKWARAGRPVRRSAGVYTRWKCGTVRKEGDARWWQPT